MRSEFPTLTPLDAVKTLCQADAPCVLDVRLAEDVALHPGTPLGAVPVAFDDIDTQLALAGTHGAITVCHKGLKLSAGAAARLAARGEPTWRMTGGQVAWVEAGLPVALTPPPALIALPLDATPAEAAHTWAVVRFIAPRAEVLEVARDDLAGVAERFGAMVPTMADVPALPGLAALIEDAGDLNGIFAAQLRGAGAKPSDAFLCLDAAYRGRLDGIVSKEGTQS